MVPPASRARSNPRPPTDPPLPPPVATSITALVAEGDDAAASKALVDEHSRQRQKQQLNGEKEEEKRKGRGARTAKGSSQGSDKKKAIDAVARERIWATRPNDSQRLKNTIRDLHRFLTGLPFPLIRITPTLVARAICKVLASQRLMPTNIVSAAIAGWCSDELIDTPLSVL